MSEGVAAEGSPRLAEPSEMEHDQQDAAVTASEANGTKTPVVEDTELAPVEPDTNPTQSDPAESGAPPIAETTPTTNEPPAEREEEEDPVEKKRIQDQLRQESRKRGNRMFGMMLGTLKRAKQQVDTSSSTDAMKKRSELEKKLKDKLESEKRSVELRTEREREVRELKSSIQRLEDEISSADSIYRVRHDAKYNLAGFLCTSFPLPTPPAVTDAISVPFNPRLPHSMHLTPSTTPSSVSASATNHSNAPRGGGAGPSSSSSLSTGGSRPIYYLPYRLLPSQEDRIEDQIDLVKRSTVRDQQEWKDLKLSKQKEIKKLREQLEEKLEQVGRMDREERQRKRRENEEREEHERNERDKRRRRDPDSRETLAGREREKVDGGHRRGGQAGREEKDTKMGEIEREDKGDEAIDARPETKGDADTSREGQPGLDHTHEEGSKENGGTETGQAKEIAATRESDKMELVGEEDLEY